MNGRQGVTLSNAVEHARGWVATKMGLLDIFEGVSCGRQARQVVDGKLFRVLRDTRTEQWGEQSNGGSSGLCSVLVGLAISQ